MAQRKTGDKKLTAKNNRPADRKVTNVQADNYSIAFEQVQIGGNVGGDIRIGHTIGYTAEQVSVLLKQITTTLQPKKFDGRCPYKGLEVFEEEDAELFFGRERLVTELVGRVKESRTVFITGPSGSGKSSLVRAGLIHALKQGGIKSSDRWLYETMKPGREPLKDLALAFSRLKSPELQDYFLAHSSEADILNKCAESVLSGRKDQRFVLFIDQFEEVFTQINSEAERVAFINMLAHAGTVANGRVAVLFSMRSDFVSNCATYPALNELLSQQFRQIGAMQPDELVSAIALPARHVGLPIEDELIARIINDMKGEPDALPLMQFALKDLFDAKQADGGVIALTLADYLKHGGIHKSLERHADATFAKLSESEQDLTRSIFSGLIEIGRGTQDTKRTALFDELIPASAKSEDVLVIVQKLADARLIITDEQAGKDTVTISHEKLIEAWPWLKKLVNENRDAIALQNEIASDAKEWDDHNRDVSYLYSGVRLANVREQLGAKKIVLSETSHEFVIAGQAQGQRNQRTRILGVAIPVGLVIVAVILFSYISSANSAKLAEERLVAVNTQAALVSTSESIAITAQAAAEEAQNQAAIARAGELAAQAQNLRQNELQLSLLMSVEAYRKSDMFQTRKILLSSSQTPVELISFYGQQGSSFSGASMAMSPDGKIIATGGDGEWIMLWNTENRKPISSVPAIGNGLIRSMAFSPDGRILAAAQDNSILLWDIVSASQIAVLYSDVPLIEHIAFSQDGKVLAASDNYRGINFWDVKTIEFLDFLPNSIEDIVGAHIAFSPDGKWFISISTECDYSTNPTLCNPKTLFFDSQSLELKLQVDGTVGRVFDISISADSKSLAISGERGVDVWDISKDPITLKSVEQTNVRSLSFSPDGKTLALGGEKITFLHLESFEETGQALIGHSGLVTSVIYTLDGKKLVSGGCHVNAIYKFPVCDKGETILWNLENINPIASSIPSSAPPNSNFILRNNVKNFMVLGQGEKTILWDANQNRQAGVLDGCTQNWFEIFFTREGNFIACSSKNSETYIWKTSPFQMIATVPVTGLENLSVNPDETLLSVRVLDQIILWDVLNEEIFGNSISIADGQWKNHVIFSPDGQYIAAGSCNTEDPQIYCIPKILVWDVKTQQLVHEITLTGQGGTIRALTFSPDGKYLVSGSGGNGVLGGDANITFWDWKKGQQIGQPLKPSDGALGDVWSLSFNPNGSILASNDEGRGIILWDTSNYQPLIQFQFGYIISDDVLFTEDKDLVIFDSDRLLLFDLSPDKWIEIVCERAGRNFTSAEWVLYFPNEEYRKTCEQWPLEPEIVATPGTTP